MARGRKNKQTSDSGASGPSSSTDKARAANEPTVKEPLDKASSIEASPTEDHAVGDTTFDASTVINSSVDIPTKETPTTNNTLALISEVDALKLQADKSPPSRSTAPKIRTLRIIVPPAQPPASKAVTPVAFNSTAPITTGDRRGSGAIHGRGGSSNIQGGGSRGGTVRNANARGGSTSTRGRGNNSGSLSQRGGASHQPRQFTAPPKPQRELVTPKLYLDMEMVRAEGWNPLGRLTLINDHEPPQVIDDTFVYHKGIRIVDTQLRYSGIKWRDINPKNGATEFTVAKQTLLSLIRGRILITHPGENEDKGLLVVGDASERRQKLGVKGRRDTQKFSRFRAEYPECSQGPGLKRLVAEKFGIGIQGGAHCSLVDTQWTRKVYKTAEAEIDAEQGVDDLVEDKVDLVVDGLNAKKEVIAVQEDDW
ncbi:hypothetical protein BDV97DRAFT_389085 [Delphinella strobiligena]|nr:hypothetical protein BDV97DRAFT_389085 [Delphinella strobiligena]